MGETNGAATKIPDAIGVNIMGLEAIYLELPAEEFPNGLDMLLTRPGELAPARKGYLRPGATVLVIGPDVANHLRAAIAPQLAKARQAGAQRPV